MSTFTPSAQPSPSPSPETAWLRDILDTVDLIGELAYVETGVWLSERAKGFLERRLTRLVGDVLAVKELDKRLAEKEKAKP